jgi:hypothetical protein
MMKPFRWTNCFADVQASRHAITIRSYFDDVIVPGLETLDRRIDELVRIDMPGREFAQADMCDVLREAKMAFALSIQSIWERQFRAYLLGCARELRPNASLANKVEESNWKESRKLFLDLRGIELDSFPSFDELDILHHLGNACRHGDGDSPLSFRGAALTFGNHCWFFHRNSAKLHRVRHQSQRCRFRSDGCAAVSTQLRHFGWTPNTFTMRASRSNTRAWRRTSFASGPCAPGFPSCCETKLKMTDPELTRTLEALWRIPPPGPDNLLSAPAFVSLLELCEVRYRNGKSRFALSTALRSLGLPCTLPIQTTLQMGTPAHAAAALDRAFVRKTTLRRHMCPLDLADTLPPLTFGDSRPGAFSAPEIAAMFDTPRLARNFPTRPLESEPVEVGRMLMPKSDFPLRLYDNNGSRGFIPPSTFLEHA